MRKIIAYIVLIICVALYVTASNQWLNNKVHAYKINTKSPLRSDKDQYGDLYDMSYLSAYKDLNYTRHQVKYAGDTTSKNIDLYVIADSYVWPFFTVPDFYCGVDKLNYFRAYEQQFSHIIPDTAKTNVFLMEFSERNLRYMLEDNTYMALHINILRKGKTEIAEAEKESIRTKMTNAIFNKKINTNLEGLIWDMPILSGIKEFKADLNYKLFGTANEYIAVSKKYNQLYYIPTIDTISIMSSFNVISDKEKDLLVSRLNQLYDEAKNAGFKKVYLTIVPNPISILEPNYNGLKYNNLVDRIQRSQQLKVPYINLLPDFYRLKSKVYFRTDSHWNWTGAYTWLDKFNAELAKIQPVEKAVATASSLQ